LSFFKKLNESFKKNHSKLTIEEMEKKFSMYIIMFSIFENVVHFEKTTKTGTLHTYDYILYIYMHIK